MTVICQHCGAEFERNPEETHNVFCSPACYHKFKTKDRYFTCPHNEGVECARVKKEMPQMRLEPGCGQIPEESPMRYKRRKAMNALLN